MKFKKIIATALITSFLFLAGCSDSKIEKTATPSGDFIKIVDCVGRELEVPKNPETVACLFAVSSHMVSMLGDSQRIVAVAQGNKRDYMFLDIYPEINNARTPKGSGDFNMEELFKDPAPELVFAYTDIVEDKKIMDKFNKFKVPVVAICFKTVEEQQYTMSLIGKIMGREEKARAYNDYYNSVIKLVSERVAVIPESDKKTVYHAINELLRTDTKNSLPADWLPLTGVKNVGVATGEGTGAGKNFLTLEQLFLLDPEYMIINGTDVKQYIEAKETLHKLTAYQKGHIFLMPLGVSRWGHPYSIETPLAILWTAKTIYPDLFTDIDIFKETKIFYKNFFDYELSDEDVQKIIEGKEFKQIMGGRETSN